MVKIMKRKSTGAYVVVESRDSTLTYSADLPTLAAAREQASRQRSNAMKRAENQILADICGTSAKAARSDMGL